MAIPFYAKKNTNCKKVLLNITLPLQGCSTKNYQIMKKLFLVSFAALALMFASCGTATEKKAEEPAAVEEVAADTAAVQQDTTVVNE